MFISSNGGCQQSIITILFIYYSLDISVCVCVCVCVCVDGLFINISASGLVKDKYA